jgi:hypothetical protein
LPAHKVAIVPASAWSVSLLPTGRMPLQSAGVSSLIRSRRASTSEQSSTRDESKCSGDAITFCPKGPMGRNVATWRLRSVCPPFRLSHVGVRRIGCPHRQRPSWILWPRDRVDGSMLHGRRLVSGRPCVAAPLFLDATEPHAYVEGHGVRTSESWSTNRRHQVPTLILTP